MLRHLFRNESIDFSDLVPEGKAARRRATVEIRGKIRTLREKNLSTAEITQALSREEVKISVRTVERVLAEEGYPRPARRTRIVRGRKVEGAEIPERSEKVLLNEIRFS